MGKIIQRVQRVISSVDYHITGHQIQGFIETRIPKLGTVILKFNGIYEEAEALNSKALIKYNNKQRGLRAKRKK